MVHYFTYIHSVSVATASRECNPYYINKVCKTTINYIQLFVKFLLNNFTKSLIFQTLWHYKSASTVHVHGCKTEVSVGLAKKTLT